MAGTVIEVLLDELEIGTTDGRKGKTRHLVLGSLIWPRPRIAERTAARTVELANNKADLRGLDWADRIMWKEVVDGRFAMEFAVTQRISDSQLAQFLRSLGSSALKLAGEEAEDLISAAPLGGVVKVPFKFLSQVIADSGKKGPKIIAAGSLDMHSKETWRNAKERRFLMPLTAPESVYRTVKTRTAGRPKTTRRKILDAGAENGKIIFRVEKG